MTMYSAYGHFAKGEPSASRQVHLRFADARQVVIDALQTLGFPDAAHTAAAWNAPAESIEIEVAALGLGHPMETMVWGVDARTEMDYVTDHASRLADCEPISHTAARMVAAWWQSPDRDGLPFAQLQSSGAIEDPDEFCSAIDRTIDKYARHSTDARRDVDALMRLKAYVAFHGDRSPLRWWTSGTSY